jgi:hypothetical protein
MIRMSQAAIDAHPKEGEGGDLGAPFQILANVHCNQEMGI